MIQNILNKYIRPEFIKYYLHDLGPHSFFIGSSIIKRQQHTIEGVPFSYYCLNNNNPTIIYVHSYNSNRLQVKSILQECLISGYNVIAIQLQRISLTSYYRVQLNNKTGMISFGYYQCDQIRPIVKWIRQKNNGEVILWGRSMGAVSVILYQSRYKGADKIILDSPFHSLSQLFSQKISQFTGIPNILSKLVLNILSSQINKILNFNLSQMNIQNTQSIKCPAIYICNPKDTTSGKSTEILYQKHQGTKKLIYTEAEHCQSRQQTIIKQILKFIQTLKKQQKPKLNLRPTHRRNHSANIQHFEIVKHC